MESFLLTPVPSFKHFFFFPVPFYWKRQHVSRHSWAPSLLQDLGSSSERCTAPHSFLQPANKPTVHKRAMKHPALRLGNMENKWELVYVGEHLLKIPPCLQPSSALSTAPATIQSWGTGGKPAEPSTNQAQGWAVEAKAQTGLRVAVKRSKALICEILYGVKQRDFECILRNMLSPSLGSSFSLGTGNQSQRRWSDQGGLA